MFRSTGSRRTAAVAWLAVTLGATIFIVIAMAATFIFRSHWGPQVDLAADLEAAVQVYSPVPQTTLAWALADICGRDLPDILKAVTVESPLGDRMRKMPSLPGAFETHPLESLCRELHIYPEPFPVQLPRFSYAWFVRLRNRGVLRAEDVFLKLPHKTLFAYWSKAASRPQFSDEALTTLELGDLGPGEAIFAVVWTPSPLTEENAHEIIVGHASGVGTTIVRLPAGPFWRYLERSWQRWLLSLLSTEVLLVSLWRWRRRTPYRRKILRALRALYDQKGPEEYRALDAAAIIRKPSDERYAAAVNQLVKEGLVETVSQPASNQAVFRLNAAKVEEISKELRWYRDTATQFLIATLVGLIGLLWPIVSALKK